MRTNLREYILDWFGKNRTIHLIIECSLIIIVVCWINVYGSEWTIRNRCWSCNCSAKAFQSQALNILHGNLWVLGDQVCSLGDRSIRCIANRNLDAFSKCCLMSFGELMQICGILLWQVITSATRKTVRLHKEDLLSSFCGWIERSSEWIHLPFSGCSGSHDDWFVCLIVGIKWFNIARSSLLKLFDGSNGPDIGSCRIGLSLLNHSRERRRFWQLKRTNNSTIQLEMNLNESTTEWLKWVW